VIELSTTTAMMLYLGLTLTFLLGLWFFQHYQLRHKKMIVSEQELFVCEYCAFAYVADGTKPVTQCPQCASFNKHNKFKRNG